MSSSLGYLEHGVDGGPQERRGRWLGLHTLCRLARESVESRSAEAGDPRRRMSRPHFSCA